jgi:ABC-2 type transport system ATP-binding protein
MSSASPAIRVRSLTRRFGDRLAVADLSFSIARGEIVALLGPNGAGKTTTLRMLAGLVAPTRGEIDIDGRPAHGAWPALRSRIGLLTETPGLWERLDVEQNLLVHARLHGLAHPAAAVAAALERFDLVGRARAAAGTLSKGLKQKVALARALLHDPPIVLLDEPTAGLDPAMARLVRDQVAAMRGEGRAVIVSTHNLAEAERLADRVAVLNQRLVALDTPAALRARFSGHRVRVRLAGADPDRSGAAGALAGAAREAGALAVSLEPDGLVCDVEDPARDTPRLIRRLVEAGAAIRAVVEESTPLEDIYLALVREAEREGSPE